MTNGQQPRRGVSQAHADWVIGIQILAVLTLGLPSHVAAGIRMPAIFGDNMVLQQGQSLPFWGTAAPGELVAVTAGGHTVRATADTNGSWRADLPPLKAGGPLTVTVAGTPAVTFSNVLVGEVWLCSGQSNMELPLRRALNADAEIAAATQSQIRVFEVAKNALGAPAADVRGGRWEIVSPATAGNFSAAGYFFAREVHQALGVPVGMIGSYHGASPAESWLSREALEGLRRCRAMLQMWDHKVRIYPEQEARFMQRLAAWSNDVAQAAAEHRKPPAAPYWRDRGLPTSFERPAGLYNGMIAPLIPYRIRGALWYQGESNLGRWQDYSELMTALIGDWRERWGQGDFPFYLVQLPCFDKSSEATLWPWLRDAQQCVAAAVTNAAMAVSIDVGERHNLHPKLKQAVGHRLALIALHDVYGRNDLVSRGPELDGIRQGEGKLRLHFRNAGGGLRLAGTNAPCFEIAGSNAIFHAAQCRIAGAEVTVWSEDVPSPMAVRYGWTAWFDSYVMAESGLPLAPFRTDRWPAGNSEARPAAPGKAARTP